MKETCLKLYGYPNRYKELLGQKEKNFTAKKAFATNQVNWIKNGRAKKREWPDFIDIRNGKEWINEDPVRVNFAHLHNFAGIVISHALTYFDLIVDPGASNHISVILSFMTKPLRQIIVYLPDRSVNLVHHIGNIKLKNNLVITKA